MAKVSIIIYPYKGNVTLLKDKVKKWRQKYRHISKKQYKKTIIRK